MGGANQRGSTHSALEVDVTEGALDDDGAAPLRVADVAARGGGSGTTLTLILIPIVSTDALGAPRSVSVTAR